jgi:hypothetical protein
MNYCFQPTVVFIATLVTLILFQGQSLHGQSQNASPAAPPPVAASAPKVKFRPNATAATGVRVTGGSRGTGEAVTRLDVLAPDEVGLTTQEQPCLFWYQSKPAEAAFELTLLQEQKVKPLLRVYVERYGKSGLQRLRLSDFGVKLEKGIEYQWVVALITDAENRSTDLVASGAIQRVDATPQLQSRLAQAGGQTAGIAAAYAEEGVWYDALATLSDQLEAEPANLELRVERAELLRQVGLKAAADATVAAR